MSKKKLYKSVLRVEILSEEPYPESVNLEDVNYDITEGHHSGVLNWESHSVELIGVDAVEEVRKQGTDLEFFQLDEMGNEIDE